MTSKKALTALLMAAYIPMFSCGSSEENQEAGSKDMKTASEDQGTASSNKGKTLYAQYCLSCHMADGRGVPGMNPPLTKTSYIQGDKTALINVLLNGIKGEQIDGEDYHNAMPPFDHLNNEQIADILTYVRSSFGNEASAITTEDVASTRKQD